MLLHASLKYKENFSLSYKTIKTEYHMYKNKNQKTDLQGRNKG